MKQRFITGVCGAAGFLCLMWLGDWWYSILVFFLATVAYLEYCHLERLHWKKPQVIISLLIVWSLLLAGLIRQKAIPDVFLFEQTNVILLGMVALFLLMLLKSRSFAIDQMSFLYVGSLYIGFGFSFLLQLIWKDDGFIYSLFIVLVVWATDTGAYFAGKYLGKHKLWPAISPNKTVEGSIGGILFALVISGIFSYFAELSLSPLSLILLGGFISVIGQIGDLIESSWKRTTGVKDSGKLLPGHGGILDRFDSLLFSCIVLHFLQLM
jgi:phosphatidate cytidylyltransferase